MVKGKKILSVDEIMDATNGGYDVYMAILGKVGRVMNRPWGRKEKHPSWGIFQRGKVWFWRDMATEESGNALHFIQKMYSLSFLQAKDKIAWDFGLGGVNINTVKVTWQAPERSKEYADIRFTHQPFQKRHHEFWNAVEVNEQHCNKYECYAVKDLAINSKRVNVRENEAVFAYYAPEEDGVKIYFPDRDKSRRFKNNISQGYLWNYSNVGECDKLIIQKSVKDMIVTTLIEPCCIATQAEAVSIFSTSTVENINKITKSPWVWWGSDFDGVKKCKEVTDTNRWHYINTPKNLLPDINDVYGYVKAFGIKELENFMKLKKLI